MARAKEGEELVSVICQFPERLPAGGSLLELPQLISRIEHINAAGTVILMILVDPPGENRAKQENYGLCITGM